ncbi:MULTISPECIES: hypothetical protein [Persicobacter]|uniref:Glycerophosphoryl diester phosphodiesterase membrane domain-containing protein n=1 Tax=Persicobacter diffluens TaxID=981 RepID=A0AAN5AMI4_9BACT|nr:hypothetical protein [Persicobacter sp. CCB-QB2]GJM61888.1 hypothetical protein PEDI_24400 [Persicobacter diffluens]
MNLRQVRSIDQRLDATFSFYKENFSGLLKIYSKTSLPLIVLGALLGLGNFSALVTASGGDNLISLIASVGGIMVNVGSIIMALQTIVAMMFYQKNGTLGDSETVYAYAKDEFWAYVGISILLGFGVVLGFMFLIIPGIFLAVAWSVVLPAKIIEELGIGAAFSKSRYLVRDNWWNTFGFFIIIGLIVWVVGVLASLPLLAQMGLSIFSGIEVGLWAYVYYPVMTVVSNLINMLTIVGMVLTYYHLLAMKEPMGIEDEISSF